MRYEYLTQVILPSVISAVIIICGVFLIVGWEITGNPLSLFLNWEMLSIICGSVVLAGGICVIADLWLSR